MIYDLTRLKSGIDKNININETYSFSIEELKQTEIMELNNVLINGNIYLDTLNEVSITLTVKGTMILPCSITLEPVPYDFNINIEGNVEEILNEMEENPKKIENTLDILPIIWENILMEIPMKVTSPNAKNVKLKGEGWSLVTEELEETNRALEDLKDLL